MANMILLCICLGVFLLCYFVHWLVSLVWLNPRKVEKQFQKQGIRGPPYRLGIGSFKDLFSIYVNTSPPPPPSRSNPHHMVLQHVLPHINTWVQNYGRVYLYWFGPSPRLVVTDPEMIKEMNNNPKTYVKAISHPAVYQLLGNGLVITEGDTWSARRKLLNPFFSSESLKGMSSTIVSIIEEMLEGWKISITSGKCEIEVFSEFQHLTRNILSRFACGRSFNQTAHIFKLQDEQIPLVTDAIMGFYIPGSRFLPTPHNLRRKGLAKEVVRKINGLIDSQTESGGGLLQENDLLGQLLSAMNHNEQIISKRDIVDDFKTMFMAGTETTLLLTWACLLLAYHTEWQEKAREEVREVLQGRPPTNEISSRLKIVTTILNETLRLYPPAPLVMKAVKKDTKLKNLTIPAGTHIEVPMIAVHHDSQQWGDDVTKFNPARFAEGVSKASKHPMAFMPFLQGPRICIGMNLSMMEAKMALSMILQAFEFTVSPFYKHDPVRGILLSPGQGVQIVLHKI